MSEIQNNKGAKLKQLDVNKYQMDDGVIISRRERKFMTYDEGARFVRIPLETITVGGGEFGTAVIFGQYLVIPEKQATN